jgi:hypothetical protein
MQIITKQYEGYTFAELGEDAKNRVRSWYCEDLPYWDEFIKEDFKTIAGLMGVAVKNIYYSGFWNQGDGAMFTGSYSYAKGSVQAVKGYAPKDETLHKIAEALRDLQRPYFYGLSATVKHHGHYYHENSNIVTVHNDLTWQEVDDSTEVGIAEALRDLMMWLYRQLEAEYSYQTSDESIEESAAANEWYFTKRGQLI